jgi:tripeptidyl-peptidase-1
VGNGSLPLKFIPLKKDGTATNGSQAADVPSSCSIITPACLQDLYGIPTALATQSSNQIAVPGYAKQYAQQADLTVRHPSYPAIRQL